ncbi:MAG: NAD(P)-binding domain-containing protein [Ignavibacteriaceae bacterium]|nr:NAD(P)-binding domain-containing protein [Ignavibacteriaceae bacterium]
MEVILENIIAYAFVFILFVSIIAFYLWRNSKSSKETKAKIDKAKELGFYEPVSLHPVVNLEICIGSGACITACPEKDILGIVNGQAFTINASRCVGHGACFNACPVHAITLLIGTEKRGIDLPHVSPEFETNVPGIFIAGELGGMGLIKNAVEQGRQAVEIISKRTKRTLNADYDLLIIGAGPAGISASLTAKKNNLKFITLEQDSLGGTVFNFPRAKLVMTSTMELPLYGKIKLNETSKSALMNLWTDVLAKNNIKINDQEKVEKINKEDEFFEVISSKNNYNVNYVLLAIGRRGSPKKLGVPGESKEKVYYRLLEPELIHDQNILIVGGGDSAIESALLLKDENNEVTISYRSAGFSRLKPKNQEKIEEAINNKTIAVIYNSTIVEILDNLVVLSTDDGNHKIEISNNLVYIFAGGELPTNFLEKIGIEVSRKYGEIILKH